MSNTLKVAMLHFLRQKLAYIIVSIGIAWQTFASFEFQWLPLLLVAVGIALYFFDTFREDPMLQKTANAFATAEQNRTLRELADDLKFVCIEQGVGVFSLEGDIANRHIQLSVAFCDRHSDPPKVNATFRCHFSRVLDLPMRLLSRSQNTSQTLTGDTSFDRCFSIVTDKPEETLNLLTLEVRNKLRQIHKAGFSIVFEDGQAKITQDAASFKPQAFQQTITNLAELVHRLEVVDATRVVELQHSVVEERS